MLNPHETPAINKRIVIVGAGVLGRILALLLAKQHNVTLFEAKTLNAPTTGYVAAAMVAPIAESVHMPDPLNVMAQQSAARWPSLLSVLGCESCYQQQGTVVLAHRQDKSALSQFLSHIAPMYQSQVKALDNQALQQQLPLVNHFADGVQLVGEANIDNQRLFDTLADSIRQHSIILHECSAVDDLDVLQTLYDVVLDTRGIGAKHDLCSLRGVRGEVIHVHAPEVELACPIRLMHPRYPLYIVPKSANRVVIGATQIESQDTGNVRIRSMLELLSAAYSVHSGFAEAEVLASYAQLRPSFADHQPRIIQQKNILKINGLYRHGYLLAPIVLISVLQQLRHMQIDIEKHPFETQLSLAERQRYLAQLLSLENTSSESNYA